MQGLPETTVRRPESAAQAALWLAQTDGARLLAGGTDLVPNLRRGIGQPSQLVDISALAELQAVQLQADGELLVGGGVTLDALAANPRVRQAHPALAEAARSIAAPSHRSAATVAGNLCQDTRCVFYNQSEWWRAANGYCLKRGGTQCHVAPQGSRCHAAFCSDLAAVLLALRARVEIVSPQGARWEELAALYRDDGAAHLTLERGELVTRLRVPAAGRERCAFGKSRVRAGIDFPLAAAAVTAAFDQGRLQSLRVGLAGTDSRPLLLEGAEYVGRAVDDACLEAVGRWVQREVTPMRSSATPAHYRRQVASVLAQRLLRQLAP
jgi:4-hydroxybenzoyl-CoA reductase subunit beta